MGGVAIGVGFLLLALGADQASRSGLRQNGLSRVLGGIVLGWTWVTIGMESLGALGFLTREALLGWSALGFVIGFCTRLIPGHPSPVKPEIQEKQGWEWSEAVALGLVIWACVLLGTISLFYAVKVVSDGPIYHLYFAARWWKSHRLDLIATPFGESAAPYFPAVGDVWHAWLMILGGGDRIAKIGQVPFFLVAGFTTFALSRRLGARRASSIVASSWFLSATPFLLFSFEPNVDTILVAGYLLSVYFLVRHALGDDGLPALALSSLAASLALGTKATGIVFVPPILILALVSAFARGKRVWPRMLGILLVMLGPVFVDGFWYLRNALLTGNPLYPLHFTAFGRMWLAGWYGREAMRESQYYIPFGDWRSFVDQCLAVFDPRMVPFWLAGLGGAWVWRSQRRSLENLAVWGVAALAVLNIALYWIAVPYRTQQRFMFHAIGLAAIPLARLFDANRWVRILAVFILAVHMLTPHVWLISKGEPPWDLTPMVPNGGIESIVSVPLDWQGLAAVTRVPGGTARLGLKLAIGFGSITVALVWTRSLSQMSVRKVVTAAGVTMVFAAAVVLASYPWDVDPRLLFFPQFREYIRGWLDLDHRSGPNGVRIAYAGTDLPYYLMGVGLRNDVQYVNIDAHTSWLMHDYHREASRGGPATWPLPRPGWDRIHPDYHAWVANLNTQDIQLLVVTRANAREGPHNLADPAGFPIESVWARAHPETFEEVYGDNDFRLFRLRPSTNSVENLRKKP